MNYTTAVFLINKHVRGVLATYDAEETAKRELFKTLDKSVKVGDFVIVVTNTRHKMTVVKIVDTDVDVDFDSPTPVSWIVAKIDRSEHEQVLEQEAEAIKAIKSAELRKKRDDLRKAMFATDNLDELKALPISAINGDDASKA